MFSKGEKRRTTVTPAKVFASSRLLSSSSGNTITHAQGRDCCLEVLGMGWVGESTDEMGDVSMSFGNLFAPLLYALLSDVKATLRRCCFC